MIKVNYQWNGNQAGALLIDAAWEGILRAVLFYWQTLLKVLNVPNTGVRRTRQRTTAAGAKGSTYTVYPNPSRPGEPPHKITGNLQRHVQYQLDRPKLAAQVGLAVGARYGLWLELGTRRMAPRPWLIVTLKKVLPQLQQLVRAA